MFFVAQKNRLIETVLLSTHNYKFWLRNKKKACIIFIGGNLINTMDRNNVPELLQVYVFYISVNKGHGISK